MNSIIWSVFVITSVIFICELLAQKTFLRSLGAPLLVIFTMLLATNLHIVPVTEQRITFYRQAISFIGPASIFLLILDTDLRKLLTTGRPLIVMFLIGSLGSAIGALVTPFIIDALDIHHPSLNILSGMFAGSYIGGGVNFNTIALHYGIIDNNILFSSAKLFDVLASTTYKILLLGITMSIIHLNPIKRKSVTEKPTEGFYEKVSFNVYDLSLIAAITIFSIWFSDIMAAQLESIGVGIPSIIILTTLAIALAQTGYMNKLRSAKVIGFYLLNVFVALSGAMVDFSVVQNIESQLTVVGLITVTILLVHSIIIFTLGRLVSKDVALISIASITNISGASFAIVFCRNTGRDQYMLPSILMGVLGTGLGSYVGFTVVETLNSLI